MPLPVIAGILGALGGAVAGILKLFDHPILAWVLVLMVLMIDAGIIEGSLGVSGGTIGTFVSTVFYFLGVPIIITSFQILVLVALAPVVTLAIMRSAQVQRR